MLHGLRMVHVLALVMLFACDSGRPIPNDGATGQDVTTMDATTDDGKSPDGTLPSCGDPKVMAGYKACRAAQSRSDCEKAGGTWTTIGLSPDPSCSCPTGQKDCVCDRSGDCLGACVAPMPRMFDCSQVKTGKCTEFAPSVGCWCWFRSDGTVDGLCAD